MTDEPTAAVAVIDTSPKTGGEVAPIVPRTLDEMFFVAKTMHASGLAPKTLDSTEKVMVAMMAGAELGFAPFQAVQSFYVVNGRPVIFGDAIPAILLRNGFKVKEWFEGEADDYPDMMTAACEVTRPDGATVKRTFSVADAKKAKLWLKSGPWTEYPRRMLQMRARAFAARDNAADALKGFQVREEVEDYGELRDVTPRKSDLRARLEANTGDRTEGFTVENVLDDIHPVQQEAPRRHRRTKAQIALDGRVETYLKQLPSGATYDAAQVAEAVDADVLDVDDSLRRLHAAGQIENTPQTADTAETPEDTAEPAEGAPDAPVEPETGSYTTGEIIDVDSASSAGAATQAYEGGGGPHNGEASGDGPLIEGAGGAGSISVAEAAGGASPDGTEAEAGTDGTGYATSGADDRNGVIGEGGAGGYEPSTDVIAYRDALLAAQDYFSVRQALITFKRTTTYADFDGEGQRTWQLTALERMDALRDQGVAIPTEIQAPWVFGLWLLSAEAERIQPTFDALKRSPDYADLNPMQKQVLDDGVAQALGELT